MIYYGSEESDSHRLLRQATAASLSGSVYTLAFAADPAIALPTEIRVPRQGADAPVVRGGLARSRSGVLWEVAELRRAV